MKSKTMSSILFIGPIAQPGSPAFGGFEASNRRTINLLHQLDLSVTELPYPDTSGRSLPRKLNLYFCYFIKTYYRILFLKKKYQFAHLTPYFYAFIWPELIIVLLLKIKRICITCDIRAGTAISNYEVSSRLYQQAFRLFLLLSNKQFVEGEKYILFIQKIISRTACYYPNYVEHYLEPNQNDPRKYTLLSSLKIIYFGRISLHKGINTIVNIHQLLIASGLTCELTIFGKDSDNIMEKYVSINSISFSGPKAALQINEALLKNHFFIFPSIHVGEGHSNALTEAMAYGVVPICSDNGFNKDIVRGAGIVLPLKATAEDYYNEIINIIKNNQWHTLSNLAINNTIERFTSKHIIKLLQSNYRT